MPVPIMHRLASRWLRDLSAYRIPWRALARTAIPGLGHIRYSNKAFGWTLLISWLLCFPLMLMTIGSTWNWTFLAMAVVIHVVAILSFLGRQLMEGLPLGRAAFGVLLFLGLWAGVYLPAGWLLEQFYVPFPIQGIATNSLFRDGDAVLYQGTWMRPAAFRRGDLVVRRLLGAGHNYALEGFALDRVLGVPGDVVRIEDGKIRVNGQPARADQMPIGSLPPGRYAVHVGGGQYMIIPSAVLLETHGLAYGPNLMDLSLVQKDYVLGRVVLRINPLWRFGTVH